MKRTEAIEPAFLRQQPIQFIDSYDLLLGKRAVPPVDDTEAGLEVVKARLRELGYLE